MIKQGENIMAVISEISSIQVFFQTDPTHGGTGDPVYLGVEGTGLAGREFPLRYEREGTKFKSGSIYKFNFGAQGPDPDSPAAWDSIGNGANGLEIFPIDAYLQNSTLRVYIRKESVDPRGVKDDALILINYGAVLTMEEGDHISFKARHDNHEENSPMYLGNEYGCKSYMFPN